MELSFLGQTSFKFKNKNVNLLIDPAGSREKADIVIYSGVSKEEPTIASVSRESVFEIKAEGEYEIGGVGVIVDRVGERLVSQVNIDGVVIAHLADGEAELTEKQIERLNEADVVLVPINVKAELFNKLEPYIFVVMGYQNEGEVEKFLTDYKLTNVRRGVDKLKLDTHSLPETSEVVILNG